MRVIAEFAHRLHHGLGRPPAADRAQRLLDVYVKLQEREKKRDGDKKESERHRDSKG